MSDFIDFPEWFNLNAGKDPKAMKYRGGSAASESYVFPQRRHIDAELIKVGGEPLLDRFNNSEFGRALTTGGIGQSTNKKVHRVSASSLVSGWSANQYIWDNYMEEDWMQKFSFKFNNDHSVLSIPGILFGSDEDPLPFELRQELYRWFLSRGSDMMTAILDTAEITGMTVEDYGVAFRISEYDHRITDYKTLERGSYNSRYRNFAGFKHQESEAIITSIAEGIRAINNTSSDTWSWICAMREDTAQREEVIETIFELVALDITPFDYNKVHSKGIDDVSLVKMVLSGEIDVDMALRVEVA